MHDIPRLDVTLGSGARAAGHALMPPVSPQKGWPHEVGSALSRLANALLGGDGAVTLSARAHDDFTKGRPWGRALVRTIDALHPREPSHCATAWAWHRDRALL